MNAPTNKKYLLLLLFAVMSFSQIMAEGNEKNQVNYSTLDYEQLDPFYSIERNGQMTLEFYDFNDNLVYTTTVTEDTSNAELAKYLNKSDFLVDYNKTSYFRLNK